MDLPKEIQAINLLYKIYGDEKDFLSFEKFYEKYLSEYNLDIKKFQEKTIVLYKNQWPKKIMAWMTAIKITT